MCIISHYGENHEAPREEEEQEKINEVLYPQQTSRVPLNTHFSMPHFKFTVKKPKINHKSNFPNYDDFLGNH